jgi:hypothetical protein
MEARNKAIPLLVINLFHHMIHRERGPLASKRELPCGQLLVASSRENDSHISLSPQHLST